MTIAVKERKTEVREVRKKESSRREYEESFLTLEGWWRSAGERNRRLLFSKRHDPGFGENSCILVGGRLVSREVMLDFLKGKKLNPSTKP